MKPTTVARDEPGIGVTGRISQAGFGVMGILVVAAILLVLIAIVIPVYSALKQRANKQVALERVRNLGGAIATYAAQNAGMLPAEDAMGTDSWENAAKPEAKDAWYNALPRLLGKKGAGDFLGAPAAFYTLENPTFLPGANYPDKKKILAPLFAIAFNTKLQRKDGDKKERTKLDQIAQPARTVVLLEQGLLNEDRTLPVQTKKDYDGSPKGSAKSFVGRYGGQGVLCFVDGHVELVDVRSTLTETGDFPHPQTQVIWTRAPEENPNKDAAEAAERKKKKQ
jgi:prepilin-type processing-associated H-X9-DG protein